MSFKRYVGKGGNLRVVTKTAGQRQAQASRTTLQNISVIIALFGHVAPSQLGAWSPLLRLMLTIFDSNKLITPSLTLAALSHS